MIHFGFPQYDEKNKPTNKFVQVDILLTEYPIFCKFYMYSPTEIQSKYKGAHRNELLRAIAKTLTYIPLKKINEEVVVWSQDDLNSTRFLSRNKNINR